MYAQIGAPPGITDLVMVTDARCRVPTELRERFLAWKARARVRVVTLVVGSQPGDLTALSDECHTVSTLDPTGEAVGRVLSL